jgi:hypothetical protein
LFDAADRWHRHPVARTESGSSALPQHGEHGTASPNIRSHLHNYWIRCMVSPGPSFANLHQRRIDISDDDELRFWMRELGVGPGELYEAIKAVGTSARFVATYLNDTAGSTRWPALPRHNFPEHAEPPGTKAKEGRKGTGHGEAARCPGSAIEGRP